MTNVIGAIVRLIQLINVTWSSVAYFVKIMGIPSQHAPILIASVELEKGVTSLTIILVLVLITVLPSKDINKGIMSWFSLPKYGCIHFNSLTYICHWHEHSIASFMPAVQLLRLHCLVTTACIMTQIALPHCYLMTQTCFPIYKTPF